MKKRISLNAFFMLSTAIPLYAHSDEYIIDNPQVPNFSLLREPKRDLNIVKDSVICDVERGATVELLGRPAHDGYITYQRIIVKTGKCKNLTGWTFLTNIRIK